MPTIAGEKMPIPPGTFGLPGVGETLAFARDPFGFVAERRARYGRVFRTSVLGRKMAVLSGPEPLAAFYDPQNVLRKGANPPNVQALFGGGNVINGLDGATHSARQTFVKAALSRHAIEAYVPTMARFIDAAFARWTAAGEIRWSDEIKQMTIETLGAVFASLHTHDELSALVARCEAVAAAFTALPIPLPGTAYTNGIRAKDESLAYFRELVTAHRAGAYDDGLARMLEARSSTGQALSDDQAAGELQHLFLAGYVTFAQLVATIVYLEKYPGVRERLIEETAAVGAQPSISALASSAYLMQVVNEVRRLTPIVPLVFGKAKRPFAVDGFEIPAGWTVAAAILQHNREASTFPQPENFDPERFGTRAEQSRNAYAYAPQGAGPLDGHRCPGFDLTTIVMALFTARLVRDYTWELPDQDLSPDWALVPPVPKDGLRARVRAKRENATALTPGT